MYNAAEIADRINSCLKSNGLSQKDMLEKCDLSKNAISTMLSRNSIPRADNLAKIADFLNCSVDFLLGRDLTVDKQSLNLSNTELDLIKDFQHLDIHDQKEVRAIISYKIKQKKEILSSSIISDSSINNLAN